MIHFRQMTPEDAAGVELVEKASFAVPWSREAFWQEAASERAFYLLVLEDERIIGYAGTWIILDEAQITNVAIVPEYRGQGIGSQLMKELICQVKARGATAMTLEVRPSNAPAIALYTSFAFRDTGRRPGYYQDNGEDAIIMWNTKL